MQFGYIRIRPYGTSLAKQKKIFESLGAFDQELKSLAEYEKGLERTSPSYTSFKTDRLVIDDPKPGNHALEPTHLIARKEILAKLSKRDELVVADYATLFLSPTDAMTVIERIANIGASLFVVEDGARYHWGEAEQGIAVELAAIAQKTHKAVTDERMQKARTTRKELGHMGGRPRKVDEKALEAAKIDWINPKKGTAQQIAERHGIASSTLIRELGPISEARKGK